MALERRPPTHRWYQLRTSGVPLNEGNLGISAWQRGPVCVMSALSMAELPDGSGGTGPQWHVSVSRRGKRPTAENVALVLRDFGMEGAEEDNHHPGAARHFWMPVDPRKRTGCECKNTEDVIVEPDGYRWTNPKTGECRGCELAVLLPHLPCTIHKGPATAKEEQRGGDGQEAGNLAG